MFVKRSEFQLTPTIVIIGSILDNSADYYTDTTGVDLEQFIPDTINRNPKDRALMLRIEEELINLVNDKL